MRKMLLILVLALVIAGSAFTCNKIQVAASSVDKIAVLNQGFQVSAQDAKVSGLISAQEDIQLQNIVIKIAQINDKLAAALTESEAGNANWKADVDAALQLGQDLNASTLLFIKNPTKQAELTAIIVGVRSVLDTIATEVGQ